MMATKEAETKKRARRQLQRRATDAQVDRCIAEHFRGWGPLLTHGVVIDGHTLYDRIKADKKAAKEGGRRLGASYWQMLKEKYGGACAAEMLKVRDLSMKTSDALHEALKAAGHANVTKRSKSQLMSYLMSTRSLNQRELVGLLRVLLTIRPSSSPAAASLVLEAMRCIHRLKLHETEASTVKVAHSLFDEALCSAYAAMKRESISTKHFWDVHGKIASVIMPASDVEEILAEDRSWARVAPALRRAVASCDLGHKMFGFAAAEVASEELGAFLVKKVATLPTTAIKMETLENFIEQCTQEVEKVVDAEALVAQRNIRMDYRGLEIEVSVMSVAEEIRLRTACRVKELAVGGHLPTLAIEDALMPVPDEEAARQAADLEVTREWRLARLACNDFLSQQTLSAEVGKEPFYQTRVWGKMEVSPLFYTGRGPNLNPEPQPQTM